jgi:hypothetical protein
LPEEDVGETSQDFSVIWEFVEDDPVFSFAFRPAAFPGQQSSAPTVSFQVLGRVGQTLINDGKGSIDVLTLDCLANLWLPVVGRLRGEKMHETD